MLDEAVSAADALNKTIWILWLQGWDEAPWLIREIAKTWETNNPSWTVVRIDEKSVHDHIDDVPYLLDPSKNISKQAISDIIRLSLLKNHGGVWADATMLCLQPLDPWVEAATAASGLWMYHGHGASMRALNGPSSWFIISRKNSPMVTPV